MVVCCCNSLQGKIRQDGSGLATFKAAFQCITYRPFRGEVLDCVVGQVNKVGLLDSMQALHCMVLRMAAVHVSCQVDSTVAYKQSWLNVLPWTILESNLNVTLLA